MKIISFCAFIFFPPLSHTFSSFFIVLLEIHRVKKSNFNNIFKPKKNFLMFSTNHHNIAVVKVLRKMKKKNVLKIDFSPRNCDVIKASAILPLLNLIFSFTHSIIVKLIFFLYAQNKKLLFRFFNAILKNLNFFGENNYKFMWIFSYLDVKLMLASKSWRWKIKSSISTIAFILYVFFLLSVLKKACKRKSGSLKIDFVYKR